MMESENINLDPNDSRVKKLLYKAHYRGTKETSHIVTLFVNQYLNTLTNQDLFLLTQLIDQDDSLLFQCQPTDGQNDMQKKFCKFLVDIQWFNDNLP